MNESHHVRLSVVTHVNQSHHLSHVEKNESRHVRMGNVTRMEKSRSDPDVQT